MLLDATARMRLMKFVCTFAWTDLDVSQKERDLVMRLAGRLGLDAKEMASVEKWLKVPPPVDEVDPATIPRAHKELFLSVAEATVRADGKIVGAEKDALAVFRDLLA